MPRPREFDVEQALDAAMDAFFGHTFALASSGVTVEKRFVLDVVAFVDGDGTYDRRALRILASSTVRKRTVACFAQCRPLP